jgi:aldehyde dehydrogenase family protein
MVTERLFAAYQYLGMRSANPNSDDRRMLTLAPLVAAIAAGNTAVLKPSEIGEATSQQTAEMVPKYLDPEAVSVVMGGIPETTALLAQAEVGPDLLHRKPPGRQDHP